MIKILYWNCRGIGNSPTQSMLHHLLHVNSPDLLFLSEPMNPFLSFISNGVHSFGFDSFLSNINNSLWCLYKSSSNYNPSLIDQSDHHITIKSFDSSSSSSSLTIGVYGSIDFRTRRSLWNYLTITSSTVLPWSVIGDFNATVLASEKLSIHPPPASSVKDFNDMVLAVGLINLGFKGNPFT